MATAKIEIQILPTRNPAEIMFRVPIDCSQLRAYHVPELYTAYKNCRIPANAGATEADLKNYVYVYKEMDGKFMWFYFCKPKTETERNTPFRTFYTSRQWRWPTVLNSLIFVPDNAFPRATPFAVAPEPDGSGGFTGGGQGMAFSPNLIERFNITPEALALSTVKVEQFLSDRPWSVNDLTHPQPTEGQVSWDFNGAKGSINCLHPDIKIPARGKAYTTVVNGTTSFEGAPFTPERIFPATNFESWEPFVISDNVVIENGVSFRERATIYPPEMNEPSSV
jgi:hypothetical protein